MGYEDRQNRGNRRRDRDNGYEDKRNDRPARAPLAWTDINTITVGQVNGRISSATLERGDVIYSFDLYKTGREDKPIKRHFDPRDFADLRQVVDEVEAFIDQHRGSSKNAISA